VTANKELIAKHGLELQALAKENGVVFIMKQVWQEVFRL